MGIVRERRSVSLRSSNLTMLALLGVAVLGVLAAAAAQKADITDLEPQPIDVTARSFDFERANPSRVEFGRLKWRGGLVLSSSSPIFGGYSGLSLSGDGGKLLAVSDAGSWLSAELASRDGKLAGLSNVRIGPITQKDGRPLQKSGYRDAESLVALKPGPDLDGRYFIGFEDFHRLDAYEFKEGELHGPVRRANLPRQLKGMSDNSGLEGVTILRGGPHAGGLVLFAERKLSRRGDHTGALVRGGKSYPLFLTRDGKFNITGLESLKDGSLLVLERSFVRASLKLDIRLRLIPAKEIKSGARLKGEVLFSADMRYVIDNFEGLAVSETEAGETLVTLISDDNFNPFQRTLLAQFALETD